MVFGVLIETSCRSISFQLDLDLDFALTHQESQHDYLLKNFENFGRLLRIPIMHKNPCKLGNSKLLLVNYISYDISIHETIHFANNFL